MTMSLDKMPAGKKGKVSSVDGGKGFRRRLEALGIMPGTEITKVSSQFMRGPAIVRVGMTQVAIGYGMAQRIMVDL